MWLQMLHQARTSEEWTEQLLTYCGKYFWGWLLSKAINFWKPAQFQKFILSFTIHSLRNFCIFSSRPVQIEVMTLFLLKLCLVWASDYEFKILKRFNSSMKIHFYDKVFQHKYTYVFHFFLCFLLLFLPFSYYYARHGQTYSFISRKIISRNHIFFFSKAIVSYFNHMIDMTTTWF